MNIDYIEKSGIETLVARVREFYDTNEYIESTKKGARAVPRFKDLTLLGKEFFQK